MAVCKTLHLPIFAALLLLTLTGIKVSECARIFTIVNYCKETIWPAVTPGENFDGGGFALKPGQTLVFTAPVSWIGRIWARTGCNFDQNGNGSCQTGSCGSSLKCSASGRPPASLAEFTLAGTDYYDVSLVDGFNLPLLVTPINGRGNCSVAGCEIDLRPDCPAELAVKGGAGNGRIWGVEVRVMRLKRMNTAAVVFMEIQSLVSQLLTQRGLNRHALRHIVMLMMILQVFLPVPGLITSLPSAHPGGSLCAHIIITNWCAVDPTG